MTTLSLHLREDRSATNLWAMIRQKTKEHLKAIRRKLRLDHVHPVPRKIIVGIVGGACLVVGVIMLITPGPAVVFIPLGVLLLATEFPWAEKWFERLRDGLHRGRARWRLYRRRSQSRS